MSSNYRCRIVLPEEFISITETDLWECQQKISQYRYRFSLESQFSGARGPPPFLKKRSENAGANANLSCGFPSIPGITPGVAPRIVVFVLLKSWDAIPRMEFGISSSESCSENTPELSESSENGLFTPRAFFLKLGWSPGFWIFFQKNPRARKIKSALPPPPPKPKIPRTETRNFMGMGFFPAERTHFPGAHKIGAAVSGPRIADKTFYGHEDFSEFFPLQIQISGSKRIHSVIVSATTVM